MKKILIVDDELEIRELLAATLRRGDYEVLAAEDGERAIRLARSEKPDVILMDIMMPGWLDGLEATRLIKNDPATSRCCVVMLTGKGREIDLEKGFIAGADDYVVKPFSPLKLLTKVDELLAW
jgi:two-component system, OmpR family, phosphate regulon response regulator PhoB